MKCPFRKMTETVDDTTREYYMDCYGEECPFYDKHINSFGGKELTEGLFFCKECEEKGRGEEE